MFNLNEEFKLFCEKYSDATDVVLSLSEISILGSSLAFTKINIFSDDIKEDDDVYYVNKSICDLCESINKMLFDKKDIGYSEMGDIVKLVSGNLSYKKYFKLSMSLMDLYLSISSLNAFGSLYAVEKLKNYYTAVFCVNLAVKLSNVMSSMEKGKEARLVLTNILSKFEDSINTTDLY